MAYAVPHYGARPTGDIPTRRGPARHQPKRNNPAHLIADIFILTGDVSVGGREARGGASGRKGPREEGRRRSGEVGWNGEASGRPRGEAKMGRRKTTARGRTTAETESRRREQETQVSSDRDRGRRCERDGLGESNDAIKGWSGGSEGGSEESETEEDRITAGDPEGSGDTLKASP